MTLRPCCSPDRIASAPAASQGAERAECDRCGKVQMVREAHTHGRRREMPLRVLLARMRHDGCGGIAGKAELLTGIESASSRPVCKIVLLG
jgi:hypothetical protein